MVLFTAEGCEKCMALIVALEAKSIAHRSFDINKDPDLYNQFNDFIQKKWSEKAAIRLTSCDLK